MPVYECLRVLTHAEKTHKRYTYGLTARQQKPKRTVALCEHRHEARETAWECPEALEMWERLH